MLTTREAILLGLIDDVRDGIARGDKQATGDATVALLSFAEHMRDAENVPDTMPAGWNRPAPATRRDLVHLLVDATGRVETGDSFEGTITWVMPTDEPELEGAEFGLLARYRVGNLDGQGGMRVFTGGEGDG